MFDEHSIYNGMHSRTDFALSREVKEKQTKTRPVKEKKYQSQNAG